MDESQSWARRILGSHGPTIRNRIPQLVREVHTASVASQHTSEQQSDRIYGLFYSGILERFECFGRLAGASLIRPGGAGYRVSVVNHIAVFPWRFARQPGKRMQDTLFSTSEARATLSELPRQPIQGTLEFDFSPPEPDLIGDDSKLVDNYDRITNHPGTDSSGLVLVAINSSKHELYSVEWGRAVATSDGRLV